jgi:hypothetical protein
MASSATGDKAAKTDTDFVLSAYETSGTEEHIIWELSTSFNDDQYADFTTPKDGNLDQVEALRIALDTLFALTDLSAQDVFNAYQVRFSFLEGIGGGGEYWRVYFGVGAGKMGGAGYVIEVLSFDRRVKRFEDIGDRGYMN